MKQDDDDHPQGLRRESAEIDDGWPSALAHWRTHTAECFDESLRAEVTDCVGAISSTDAQWRAAVGGCAAAACGLALRLGRPDVLGPRLDLVMTVLLARAFGDAGAAAVLSHVLGRMPLDRHLRRRLASSWLAHDVRIGRGKRGAGQRSIASATITRTPGAAS